MSVTEYGNISTVQRPQTIIRKKNENGLLTVLVPAFNEEESIADTIKSLQGQTVPIHEIVVIDDGSSDGTADIARSLGVIVIAPPMNTGSKAGAQNFALENVETEFTMAIDADTVLAPDAVEKLLAALNDKNVAAACGFVIPRHVRSIWERGRYIEYLFAFSFFKQIQDYFEKPLISSGCFSVYRTKILKESGGWSTRTLAEDMDLTWSFYEKGYGVRFIPGAMCYPIEPHNFKFMSKQLKRWSHGFVQNVRLHWPQLRKIRFLNYMITVLFWDGVIASIVYLLVLPLLTIIFQNPLFLVGYIIDVPAVLVPALIGAYRRKEVWKVLTSIPGFFVLRTVNSIFMLEAMWTELVLNKTFKTYEKGH